jgi:hypothetical protein
MIRDFDKVFSYFNFQNSCMKHPFVIDSCGKYVLDETLANFIKHNSTQQQRGKEEQSERMEV